MGVAPFVGRAVELEAMSATLDRAAAGTVCAISVEGEAGIGKSRITAEVMAAAARRGFTVALGAADEINASRPLGPFYDALSSVAAPIEADESLSDYVQRTRVLNCIEQLAGHGPLMLVIEDVQWADPATVATLADFSRQLAGLALLLVVTARRLPREPALDVALARFGERIQLGPLGEADASALVTAHHTADVAAVVSRAGGNPFFLLELARAADEAPGAEPGSDAGDELASELVDAVFARLRTLSPDTLDVIRVASVLGSTFALADLTVVCGRPAAQLLPHLMEAMRAGVVGERDNRLVFRHDIVRDATYQSVPATARAAMHRDAAEALAAAGAPAGRVADQLWLAAEPGDVEAVTWLRRAAADASGTPALAAQLLQRAATLTRPGDRSRAEIFGELVLALQAAGRLRDAEATCRQALDEVDDPELAASLYVCLVHTMLVQGRAEEVCSAAATPRVHPLGARDQALTDNFAAMAMVMAGDAPAAEAQARRVVAECVADPDAPAAYFAQITLSCALRAQGRVAEALTHVQRAAELGRTSTNSRVQIHDVELFRLMCLIELGDLEECARSSGKGRAAAERLGLVWNLPDYHYLAGRRLLLRGEWADAGAEFEAGLSLDADVGSPTHADGLAFYAWLLAHLGDIEGADNALTQCHDVRERAGNNAALDLATAAEALVARARGGADPFATLDHVWSHLEAVGVAEGRPFYAADLVRGLRASGDHDRAGAVAQDMVALADRSGSPLYEAIAAHCLAVAAADVEQLDRAVQEYRRLGVRFYQAQAAEDAACSVVGDTAQARPRYEAALEGYQSLGAGPDSARVNAALRALGVRRGSRAPRVRATAGWESLTPTELAVVALIAEGLTSAQVAARLYVSPHTVITHVKHVFAKLGVSSRVELAAVAAQRRYRTPPQS